MSISHNAIVGYGVILQQGVVDSLDDLDFILKKYPNLSSEWAGDSYTDDDPEEFIVFVKSTVHDSMLNWGCTTLNIDKSISNKEADDLDRFCKKYKITAKPEWILVQNIS